MADEDVWRGRFQVFMVLRLFGVLLFIAGVVIALTDLVQEGGWPEVGGILAVFGALEAVLIPRLLKRQWSRQDDSQR